MALLLLVTPLLLAAPLAGAKASLPSRLAFAVSLLASSPLVVGAVLRLLAHGCLLDPAAWQVYLFGGDESWTDSFVWEVPQRSSIVSTAFWWLAYVPAWSMCAVVAVWPGCLTGGGCERM